MRIVSALVALFFVCHTNPAESATLSLQKCTKVIDIVMVVDESGSIGKKNFDKVKAFLQDMISHFSVSPFGAHFGIVKYSRRPRLVFSLTKYTDAAQLHTAVRNMRYLGGSTFTGAALRLAKEKVFGQNEDRKDVPNVLVIFSDGQSHDHSRARIEAAQLKNQGVAVLCVAIGRGSGVQRLTGQLKELASEPEYVFESTVDALQTIEASLAKDMCKAADPCSSQPCKNGGECQSNGESYQCKCPTDYEGKNCEFRKSQKCTKVVDIAMVVDESGSIGQVNFDKVKTFLQDIISHFSVAPFGAHFGIVKYSRRPRLVVSLTKYTDSAQLQTAVRNMRYLGGSTYTGAALRLTREQVFGQNEDRKNVPNILVVFSDGQSHDHSRARIEAAQLKNQGVAVLCVAIGRGSGVHRLGRQLQELVSEPEYVFESTVDALQTIENSLAKDMCEAASACLSQPCKNGGECLTKGESYECKCTPDYEGKDCEIKKWCTTSFAKQGCYTTPVVKAPQQLLFNRRDNIEWGKKWDEFLETIVCDCGKAAKAKGYKYFCIEFYAECWGYHGFEVNQSHADPGKCWGKRPVFDKCMHEQQNPACVGVASHGYIYALE